MSILSAIKFATTGLGKFAAKKTFGGSIAKHVAFNMGIPVGLTLLTSKPEDRLKETTRTAAESLLFLGMSPGRALVGQIALSMAPMVGDGIRGIYNYNREGLERRSMASVPFSYSTGSMDFVQGQYQLSRARDGKHPLVGNEAAFFASRYMSR